MKLKLKVVPCAEAALAAALSVGGLAGNVLANETGLNLIEDKTYELGDKVILEPEEFVSDPNGSLLSKVGITSDLMDDESKYDYDQTTREVVSENKNVLDVGTYDIQLNIEGRTDNVTFKVEDTTAPTIKDLKNEIYIEVNSEIKPDDFKQFFDVEDLSDFDVEIELSNVDVTQVGVYPMLIIATDKYSNKSEEKVNVYVISTSEAEETGKLTPFVSGVIPVSAETRSRMEAGETNIVETVEEESSENLPEETKPEMSNDMITPSNPNTTTPANPTDPSDPGTLITPIVTTTTTIVETRMSDLEERLWNTINDARSSMGLSRLTRNAEMAAVADTAAQQSAAHDSTANEVSGTTDSGVEYVSKTNKTYDTDTYSSTNNVNEQFGTLVASDVTTTGNVAVYQSQVTKETKVDGVVTDTSVSKTSYYATVVVDQPEAETEIPTTP